MADPIQPTGDAGNTAVMPVLYKEPRPLDVQNFGGYGIKNAFSASFARSNTVPLVAGEFQVAHMFFPIIFVGEEPMPVCVLGFDANQNLFLTPDDKWADDIYVPAYVRRYPFILAELPGDDRKFLCADFGSEAITNDNPDRPFFDAEGKGTEVVQQALEFCRQFQEDVILTQAFCAELKNHGLLKLHELRLTMSDGSQQSVGTFTTIDPASVDALSDSVFLDFRKRGLLPLIYMQQASLQNWGWLNMRRERARAQAANSR